MASRDRVIDWSPEAKRDIDGIWDYLKEQASVRVADEAIQRILRACNILVRHPFAGRPRADLIPGLRSILSNPYSVFYRVGETKIEIVRVVHQRRDIASVFNSVFKK